MKTFLLSLTILAFAAAVQSAEPPSNDVAAKVAVALAAWPNGRRRRRFTPPIALVIRQRASIALSIPLPASACQSIDANQPPVLLHKAAAPKLTYIVVSRRDCVPCLNLAAELRANGKVEGFPGGTIYTDRPDLEYDYGITAFPTILLFENNKVISRHVGYMSAADLLHWVQNPDEPQSRGESMGANDVGMVGSSWSGDRGSF